MLYNRKKNKFFTLLVFIIILFVSDSFAYKIFEFTTVSDVVKKVRKKFLSIESYQADFKIVSEKLGNKAYKNGRITYKATDKMLIEFINPGGQRIVSDGKRMWIHISSMNVVAEQDLKSSTSSIFSSATGGGLKRLFSKYHYKFASKTQPEKQTDGTMQYTLFLKQKESRSGFRTIKLWISEDFLIRKAVAESSTGKNVEISFNNIKTNIALSNGIFQFDIPSQAKIIKNPMISEE
ncbi:MAG: outer-membrane lipoprotein carrier protein LolA [Spirochaetota bacterium]